MDPKDKEILKDYETSLEDLTFNSKPIINMLTMMAEKHRRLAPQIVELVQSRFFKVRQEHKIPTLYLMDSMIKNLGGEFLEVITKNIVGVFCHAFECMNDPKIRISLYKLRQTWPPYVPVKKLAAIDKHINAIDPNWPITAQDPSRQDPSSPTIFLNPKFLGSQKEESIDEPSSSSETSASKSSQQNSPPTKIHRSKNPVLSQNTDREDTVKNISKDKIKKRSQSPKDEKTQHRSRSPVHTSKEKLLNRSRSPLNVEKSRKSKSPSKLKDEKPQQQTQTSNKSSNLSIQDRRQKLLEEQRKKKFDKQRAMGLLPPKEERQRSLSPSPEKKNADPRLKRSTRPRSASPTVDMETNKNILLDEVKTREKHKALDTLDEPASKQLRLDNSYSTNDKEVLTVHKDMVDSTSSEDHFKAISHDLLELNDLPPELLRQHQDYMLKQAEIRLKSGTLSKEEHQTLVKQVDQLYNLQRQSNQNRMLKKPNSPPQNNQNLSNVSSLHAPHSSSHIPPSQPPPPSHNISVPHHTHPLSNHMSHSKFDDKFPPVRGRRPHMPSRGNFRPWPRDGPRDIPRLRHRGQGFHNRPPSFRGGSPPRHFPRPGPPPPSQGRPLGPPPSHSMNVLDLYQQLEKTGLLKVDSRPPDRAPNVPSISHPLPLIPAIRLNVKELKKRYDHVTDLLHRGEPCTSCGLRFTEDQRDAYQQHLDWHYQENRMDKEGTRGMMRNWYLHPEDWLTFEGTQLPNQNEPVLTMEQEVREESIGREDERSGVSCQVLPGEDNQVCGVCHEQLEQFWEEDEEEWHFRDAIRTPDRQLFHSYCYVDSKESQGLMSLESSPVEERDRPVLESKM